MKVTNKNNLPQALVNAVGLTQHNKEGCYSATTLLHGVREILLTKRHWEEMEADVSDSIWTIFGTAVHSIMENQKDDTFKEEYFEIPVSDSKLTGKVDCYDLENEILVDWKTASTWKVIYHDFDDWKKQGLIYAYLLGKNGLKVKHCKFVAMLKDFSKTKAKVDSSYPQSPVYTYEFDVTEKDLEETEKFVNNKIEQIEYCQGMNDKDLPPCTKEERWATDDKFAVMKNGRKSAVRVLDNKEDAEKLMASLGTGHYVELRKGESKKCKDYCMCKDFCSYYKNNIKEK